MTTIYTINNKVLKNSVTDKWLIKIPVDPYNPLGLPSNTIRVRTRNGNEPIGTYDTATLVPGTTDVYDVYRSGTDFSNFFYNFNSAEIIEVLGANTTDIINMEHMFCNCSLLTTIPLFDTSSVERMRSTFEGCSVLTAIPLFDTSSVTTMERMFYGCTSLTSVPLFDTSSVTNMSNMFYGCSSLTTVPLFDTSSVTDMSDMFRDCSNVESGALALYNQASTQTTSPSYHMRTFRNCGSNTTTGAAELEQIPSGWK